jgi:uncharacterized UBP type Zn finger protein
LVDIDELAHLRKKRPSPLESNDLFKDDLLAAAADEKSGKKKNFDTSENIGSATNDRDRYKDKVEQLVVMGFSAEKALDALQNTKGSMEAALEALFSMS